MMLQRFRSLFRALIPVCLLCLAGCGPDTGSRTITVGGTATPGTPGEAMWLKFRDEVATASHGKLRVRPLIYGQLGSEEQLLSGLRRGRIQFANLSAQVTSTVVPELAILYAPYLFDSEAQADFVYDRYLTDVFRRLLAQQGLYLLTWYEIGFHHIYSRTPLLLPQDVRGRRFRVSASLTARLFAQALHADVIPLGYGEIVSSLQTGLVTAGENSVSLYARTGIAPQAPYLTLTGHALGMSVIVAQKAWWDGLSGEDRGLLRRSFPSIGDSRRLIRAETAAELAAAADLGFNVRSLNADQKARWRAATAGMTETLIETIGGQAREIYDLIQKGKAEFAAR